MAILVRFLLAGSLLLFAGACQTAPSSDPAREQRTFQASLEEVSAEVTALLSGKGYRIVVHEPIKGRIEALSPLRSDAFGQTIQYRLRVGLVEESPARSIVWIRATVLEESEILLHGRAIFERPLRDPAFFEWLFDELAVRLNG